MEPLLSINTKMEKKDYANFHFINFFKKNRIRLFLIFLFTLLASIISNLDDLSNIKAILLNWIILTVIFISIQIIQILFRVKSVYDTDKGKVYDTYVKIDFFEDRLKVYGDEDKSFSEIPYTNIYSIYETKNYFLIYLNKYHASVVRKSDLENSNELRNLLQKHFSGKYKNI